MTLDLKEGDPDHQKDKNFFFHFALFITLVTFSGFIANSVDTPQRILHINFWTAVHAIVSALWYCLLLVQLKLSRAGNVQLHRALGRMSALLVISILVTGLIMTYGLYERLVELGVFDLNDSVARLRAGSMLGSTFFQWASFVMLYLLGLFTIRAPKHHKRFMIAASIQRMPEGINRLVHLIGLPGDSMLIMVAAVYLTMLVNDWRSEGRLLWSTLVSFMAFFTLAISIKTWLRSQGWGDWVINVISTM